MTFDEMNKDRGSSLYWCGLNRRRFLQKWMGTTGALVLAGCNPTELGSHPISSSKLSAIPSGSPDKLKVFPDGLNPLHFHVHNRSPLALETRRSAMGQGMITPVSRFFVRNNLPRPDEKIIREADAWRLTVSGVSSPGTMTLAEIKNLGLHTEAVVLQCSGNGRQFFNHGPSGSQWATGAAGCAIWTGVRVSTVLDYFGGAEKDARFLTSTGGEELPEGVDRNTVVVERSVPLEKAHRDCLLAWEMNGQPIPISHGGPLRLIVPGYFGCNNIKYVKTIAATVGESPAKIQAKGYRFRPIGEKGAPTQPSMWRMPVKSWINGPGADDQPVLSGDVYVYGFALSGERGIAKVDISMDDGKTWERAELNGPDLGPNAWHPFVFKTSLSTGAHTVYSRATDTKGDVQPKERPPNERGYGHNGWQDHGLTIHVVDDLPEVQGAPQTAQNTIVASSEPPNKVVLSPEGERGKQVFSQTAQPQCGVCHQLADAHSTGTTGPNLDELKPDVERVRNAVTNGVGAMPSYGQGLTTEQLHDLATYVFESTQSPK